MSLIKLTLQSILSRKLTTALLVISISLSVMLLIGIQKIKYTAKHSFNHSISGTDLIVGSRSGESQLLLYSVFRQGQPVANMSWDSAQSIKNLPQVEWLVPLSLGDSHKGYPVLGTSIDYFTHYKYGKKQSLSLKKGTLFQDTFDVVLGSEIANTLQYTLNDTFYLSHGMAKTNLPVHKQKTFKVVGVLNPTGTPVDKTVHIPIEGITAIHINWNKLKQHENLSDIDLTPHSITSCLVGLTSKFSIFSIQKKITEWTSEPLLAIIPGVALSRLWNSIGTVDIAFSMITILVVGIAFIGLLLSLFMSLHQRKRELTILRILGAYPWQLCLLVALESLLITVSSVILGIILMLVSGTLLNPILESKFGLILSLNTLSFTEFYFACGIVIFGLLTSLFPAYITYKKGCSDSFNSL